MSKRTIYRSREDRNHNIRVIKARQRIMAALFAAEKAEEKTTFEELCEALATELHSLLACQYVPTGKREEEKSA